MRPYMNMDLRRLLALGAFVVAAAFPARAQAQQIPLGTEMPGAAIVLQDLGGQSVRLGDVAGRAGTVVVFWSNQCPWVDKYEARLFDLAAGASGQGVSVVLVNANDPQAFPRETAAEARGRLSGKSVRYVSDAGGQLARAFGAERTPHVYLFDADSRLVYVGTIDDSPGDPTNVQKFYLREAIEAVAAGRPVPVPSTKAFGCTIKLANPGG